MAGGGWRMRVAGAGGKWRELGVLWSVCLFAGGSSMNKCLLMHLPLRAVWETFKEQISSALHNASTGRDHTPHFTICRFILQALLFCRTSRWEEQVLRDTYSNFSLHEHSVNITNCVRMSLACGDCTTVQLYNCRVKCLKSLPFLECCGAARKPNLDSFRRFLQFNTTRVFIGPNSFIKRQQYWWWKFITYS